MTDRELLELIAAQVGALTKDVSEIKEGQNKVESELGSVNEKLGKIENRVTVIEEDHSKKLTLLLDGYKQNADKLDVIEKEVSKHEEVIIRRVK